MASTEWKENIPAGEAEHLEALAEQIHALQKKAAAGGGVARALHAKGNAGVEAEFTVLGDLPPEARVGVFAQAGSFRAYVRYSNGAGRRQSDKRGDVRGVAFKLLGVPGKKLIPGMESAPTQDFLLIRTPSQPFRNADEFVWLVNAAQSPALLPIKLLGHFGFGRGFSMLKQLLGGLSLSTPSVGTAVYYSALPIRWGAHAARYSLAPEVEAAPGDKGGSGPEYFGTELAARLAKGPVSYHFRVQFFTDEEKTPIEDASRDWDAPWVTLARLTLPKQEPDSPRGKKLAAYIESLSFDPWHAPEEFRPLGNMMRARNHAYRLSTIERKAAGEPDGSEKFD